MISAVREKCAGLDVHRDFVMACLMWGPAQGEAASDVRRFEATVPGLEQLRQWLTEHGCQDVVAESTGPYWEAVLNVLEGSCRFCLANAQEVKNRRGHKTDKKDAWWLAHLYRHDMIRASYVPVPAVRQLRALTRRRRELVREAAQEKNRVQKLLEQSNIKLRSVLSDVFGASGAAILEALVKGEREPQRLADLARGQLQKKKPQIAAALKGFVLSDVHRFLIRETLEHLAVIVQHIDELDEEIAKYMRADARMAQAAELLKSIPGFNQISAAETVAEVGPDVKAFPSAAHLSSWAGVCPGNHESAGKRRSSRTTKGNPYWRATLNQSAWATSRQNGSAFQRRYDHLSPKLKHKGAIVAVAHALVYAIYNILKFQRPYQEIANAELSQDQARRRIRHHEKRIKHLKAFLKEPLTPDLSYGLARLNALL
jgi:transposase